MAGAGTALGWEFGDGARGRQAARVQWLCLDFHERPLHICHRSPVAIKCAAVVGRLTERRVAVPQRTCVGCICASNVHDAACLRFPCRGWGAARVLLTAAVLCIHRTLLRMGSYYRKAVSNVGRTACRRSWVRTPGVAGGLGTVQLGRPAWDCVWASQIAVCYIEIFFDPGR